eukprot:gene758-24287_t
MEICSITAAACIITAAACIITAAVCVAMPSGILDLPLPPSVDWCDVAVHA